MKLEIKNQPFIADFYHAPDSKNKIVLIVVGGSEGGNPSYFAEQFVEKGFSVLSLAYFKETTLPDNLELIPLEYFDAPISWLQCNYNFDKIVFVGISKGAELALLLASIKNDIYGVIAYSPSSVVFEGFGNDQTNSNSSWTINNKQIKFVPFDVTGVKDFNDYYTIYKQSLTQTSFVENAIIEVENISGPILLLSGSDDRMWPSKEMAEMIVNRLKTKNFKFKSKHICFDGAGHVFSEYYTELGGNADSNKIARVESMEEILKFF